MWNQFSYFTVLTKLDNASKIIRQGDIFQVFASQSGEETKTLQGLKIQNKNIIYINNDGCAQLKHIFPFYHPTPEITVRTEINTSNRPEFNIKKNRSIIESNIVETHIDALLLSFSETQSYKMQFSKLESHLNSGQQYNFKHLAKQHTVYFQKRL